MTLVSQIISDAYRESNLIGVGTSPTSAETTEALRLLNSFITSLFGLEMGENLIDVPLGKNNVDTSTVSDFFFEDSGYLTVPENSRLILNLEAAETVTLPSAPQNGARFAVLDVSGNLSTYNLTVDGNGKKIAGSATATLSTDGLSSEYFYRADLGDWKLLSTLTDTDSSPFPTEYDDFLSLALAMRLNPRNGVALDQQSLLTFARLRKKFISTYSAKYSVGSELGLLYLPSTYKYGVYPTTRYFELGDGLWPRR